MQLSSEATLDEDAEVEIFGQTTTYGEHRGNFGGGVDMLVKVRSSAESK